MCLLNFLVLFKKIFLFMCLGFFVYILAHISADDCYAVTVNNQPISL